MFFYRDRRTFILCTSVFTLRAELPSPTVDSLIEIAGNSASEAATIMHDERPDLDLDLCEASGYYSQLRRSHPPETQLAGWSSQRSHS